MALHPHGSARVLQQVESAAEAEIARRRRQQSALAELGQAALTGVDVTILVGQTCALVEWALGATYVSVTQFERGSWRLRFGVGSNETFDSCNDEDEEHQRLLRYALVANEPVVFTNPAADPRLRGDHLVTAHGIEAGACLPIPERDGIFGVLTAYADTRRNFSADEIDFLRAVADLTGAMIASAANEDARRRAEAARAATEDRFRALVENSSEGIALVDAHGNFVYAGPSTERLLGHSAESLLGRNFAELLHPDDLDFARRKLKEMLAADGNETRGEARLHHANGTWRWMEGVYKNLLFNPSVRAIVINYRDVTDRKLAEQQLEQLAYRDSLTDLPNRFLFHDRLEHAIEQARRRARGLSVMYIDLDRFKVVNDTLGHAVGDKLLQVAGRRLREVLRVDDTIARLGGDEFAVILPDVDRAEDAGGVARKLLQALRAPITVDGHELHVTGSIGIAVFPSDGEDTGTLVKHADAALYRSKDSGRNTVRLFAHSMNARYTERLELELSLHHAVDRGEFELVYQPIVDRETRVVRSFEALIRWNRPGHGLVSPSEFIKLAEETRLIIPIGAWALRTAAKQLAAWRRMGLPEFHVAVNISAHEIAQPQFIHNVHGLLQELDLRPEDLELEVTESAALQNLEWTLSVLDSLKTLGVRIAVDDFGTGQSSLVYLKRLPLHTLKIDREFLRDVQRSDNDTAILASIIQLGHSLNLYVIAEGIETDVERRLVEEQCCDAMQGYLFSKPMAASAVPEFVSRFRYPAAIAVA